MKKGYILFGFILFSACSYSITLVHTDGEANDVVDQSQTPSSEIDPSFADSPKE